MECVLNLSEVPLHLYQIIAGLALLDRKGAIRLKINRLKPDNPLKLPYNMLEVLFGGKRIVFDMNDGYGNLLKEGENYKVLYDGLTERCDILYKRSFHGGLNERLSNPGKFRPTAPNFLVTVKGSPAHWPVPCDPPREKVKKIIRMLPANPYSNSSVYEENFRTEPVPGEEPRILFMARLWDPAGDYPGQLTGVMSEERREINESRAKCIRRCRKEFGSRFFGGITYSAFAEKEYGDLLLDNAELGRKEAYLARMKSFDIQIATMGLHKSTGWKFAEYIAAAKAIVTEPLYYSSAGGLADGKNYFSFKNEFECCEKIETLFDQPRRYRMMKANKEYYDEFMSCEKMASRALGIE